MKLLLKDCGLEGCQGSVQRCEACARSTVHFARPGGWPVCGVCGEISRPVHPRRIFQLVPRRMLPPAASFSGAAAPAGVP